MGDTTFQGDPPFALPTTQRAKATVRHAGQRDASVEVTLYVFRDGGTPAQVHTTMTYEVARVLAAELSAAALQIESGK